MTLVRCDPTRLNAEPLEEIGICSQFRGAWEHRTNSLEETLLCGG